MHVLVPDMPFVGPGVNRDTLGSETLTFNSCLQNIRNVTAACIPQRCNFIYIYA
jgi:hypothetical protein